MTNSSQDARGGGGVAVDSYPNPLRPLQQQQQQQQPQQQLRIGHQQQRTLRRPRTSSSRRHGSSSGNTTTVRMHLSGETQTQQQSSTSTIQLPDYAITAELLVERTLDGLMADHPGELIRTGWFYIFLLGVFYVFRYGQISRYNVYSKVKAILKFTDN